MKRRISSFLSALGTQAMVLAGCSDVEKAVTGSDDKGTQAQTIQMSADSAVVPPNGTTGLALKVQDKAGNPVKDGTKVDIKAGLGRVEPSDIRTHNGGSAKVTYRAGGTPGNERLEAQSGEARAELPLSIQVAAAPPPPPPGPPVVPAPVAPGGGSAGGPPGLDPRSITFLDPDISGWPETSRITRLEIGAPPICIYHTKAGQWPVKDGLEGNPWVIANMGGRWYAATWEWLGPGQQCKGMSAEAIGPHIGRAPLSSWRPRSGELVGWAVSARARFRADTVQERSNVVWSRWP